MQYMLKLSKPICRSFTSAKNVQSVIVGQSESGKRLDQYLKKMGVGWPVIHKLLRNKCFYVRDANDTVLKHPQYRLRVGDTIYYHKNFELREQIERQQEKQQPKIPRQKAKQIIERMVLFQNENIIVLNKEGGYSTQGDQQYETNLFTLLTSYLQKSSIHIVHRIDKASTGLVMFAKNERAANVLQDSINNRKGIHKFYLALSSGVPLKKSGLIDCNIEWSDNHNKAKLSLHSNKSSKQCLTYYKSIEQQDNFTTYLIKLISGRKHQIRCHLSKYLETPIINDHHYQGECLDKSPSSIYLHAYMTVFDHRDVVEKVFKRKQMTSANGSVEIVDNQLWLKGKIPWQRSIPSQDFLHDEIEKLVGYNPEVRPTKTIVY